jgi:hypothetical protein
MTAKTVDAPLTALGPATAEISDSIISLSVLER